VQTLLVILRERKQPLKFLLADILQPFPDSREPLSPGGRTPRWHVGRL
jgi:hypothetical protein